MSGLEFPRPILVAVVPTRHLEPTSLFQCDDANDRNHATTPTRSVSEEVRASLLAHASGWCRVADFLPLTDAQDIMRRLCECQTNSLAARGDTAETKHSPTAVAEFDRTSPIDKVRLKANVSLRASPQLSICNYQLALCNLFQHPTQRVVFGTRRTPRTLLADGQECPSYGRLRWR